MRHKNFTSDRHPYGRFPSPTVMRAPIDQYHSLELTFNDGADTQYRIVTRDLTNAE